MKFYKIVQTKELHKEKWVMENGQKKKIKSISLNTTTETSSIYKSQAKALKVNKGKVSSASTRKNTKMETVGKITWGVDEVLYFTWKVQAVEIPKEDVVKFESGNMMVAENGKTFIVYDEKELEK
jgi:hypothetical protein